MPGHLARAYCPSVLSRHPVRASCLDILPRHPYQTCVFAVFAVLSSRYHLRGMSKFQKSNLRSRTDWGLRYRSQMCDQSGARRQEVHRFTQAYAKNFITSPHALLLIEATHLQQWLGVSHPLERHPFSGLVHSAGELLHTP